MLNKTCVDFIEVLSSKESVPGGGGASALVGAVGLALGTMVGNLTAGKKKYAQYEEDIQRLMKESKALTLELEAAVNKDAEAFAPLAKAYGMPTGTEEEKLRKEETMAWALVLAAEAPLDIARLCVKALELLEEYAEKGSHLAISDAGTGAAMCKAALQGAKLNVLINLNLMKDAETRQKMYDELDQIVNRGLTLADEIYEYVAGECYKHW